MPPGQRTLQGDRVVVDVLSPFRQAFLVVVGILVVSGGLTVVLFLYDHDAETTVTNIESLRHVSEKTFFACLGGVIGMLGGKAGSTTID